jgi:hypothetical protein
MAHSRPKRLHIPAQTDRLTHYLFRYPAKFHAPVVRTLLREFSSRGDLVLDPFCGSGTLLVEAARLGRDSVGLDVDPVAISVARAKVHVHDPVRLERSIDLVLAALSRHRRSQDEYDLRQFVSLSPSNYKNQMSEVEEWVPPLPRLFHWFRNYVVVDLARIRSIIETAQIPSSHRDFLRIAFASIIRNVSNADPVPVSGLEVTAHMRRRDAEGRILDPFAQFEKAVRRALADVTAFAAALPPERPRATLIQGDATSLTSHLRRTVDAVITSPPYHGAVDYYRRHTLEAFWLGLTTTQDERDHLRARYIGRPKVPKSHGFVLGGALKTELAQRWEKRIRAVSEKRADAFRHYLIGMSKFFDQLRGRVAKGAPVVLVVGHSTWNNSRIPTSALFQEIATDDFKLSQVRWYPIRNRYMSYDRHNHATIDKEYVLVFRRR